VSEIGNFPQVTFRIGNGETKTDREWLKKRKEFFEKMWVKNGFKILQRIEDICGCMFTAPSREEGIVVLLHKKKIEQISGCLSEENPLEINIYCMKKDSTNALKERLVRMLINSFIQQQYEFCFRIREQVLFEDILANELVASKIGFMVMGKKIRRVHCARALDEAVALTVYRLSQKHARNKLVDITCSFFQEQTTKDKKSRTDIISCREGLVAKLLELLPKTLIVER
jgi:hypothetical protein